MLIILSPTKTLDMSGRSPFKEFTLPENLSKSKQLTDILKKKSIGELTTLMNISPKLAQLNYERFQQWQLPLTTENAKQALYAFKGEVFNGLDSETLQKDDITFAQSHLIILSGLYGTLRPLDLIQPYRLEMGTKSAFAGSKNLYDYWKPTITGNLQKALDDQGDNYLINLASNEYFKSIDIKTLDARIITPQFKEFKNGSYKMVTIYAKKARGLMTRFIIQNRLSNPDELKLFDLNGYFYNEQLTADPNNPVFTRN